MFAPPGFAVEYLAAKTWELPAPELGLKLITEGATVVSPAWVMLKRRPLTEMVPVRPMPVF